ncbi:glycosyltransferase family 39 protein [Dysgonomonas sp. Marseille-P4361]|uniref:ArnT family glycosyltransferase n=1 Tax=Dysgonomonas sp. Marseille-P4361 TaxID=2161820 RepID=UPI000D555C28|nr:hypothetical protein [Dysgonomonas sp. Marseille-P4361]
MMTILIFLGLLILFFILKKTYDTKTFDNHNDKLLYNYLQPILIIGILVRTVYLMYPYGVFWDEAINAYDAWCIDNYGVDQHLASYPVYLESWGTGQSALYAYFALPFIKLFGMSTVAHRMAMALLSCSSLLFFYWTLTKTQRNTLYTFTLITFFLISPWHIMKSRWGLDCNVCPDLVLIGLCFFILAYYSPIIKKQTIYYILGFSFLAIAAYGYGVSWLMLPFMVIALVVYLIRKKKITTKQILLGGTVMLLLAIPIILFAFNLFFDGEEFKLGPITIIGMEAKRDSQTILMSQEPFLRKIGVHIHDSARLLIKGADTLNWNNIEPWGQFYNIIGIPFILYYFYVKLKNKNLSAIDMFFIIWAVSCLPILLFVSPNVNHWNLLWFPLLYFCGCGIYLALNKFKKSIYIIVPLFSICFFIFTYQYFNYYSPKNQGVLWEYSGFNYTVQEPVKFVQQREFDEVYYCGSKYSSMDNGASMILFYMPLDPHSIVHKKYDGGLNLIHSCGNNFFYLPDSIIPKANTAYVISEDRIGTLEIDFTLFNRQDFDSYAVLWND